MKREFKGAVSALGRGASVKRLSALSLGLGALLAPMLLQATPAFTSALVPPQTSSHRLTVLSYYGEPLVPIGIVGAAETQRLHFLLAQAEPESQLRNYLTQNPSSAYRAALFTQLGVQAMDSGRYSQALQDLEAGWSAGKHAQELQAKAQADKAIGELLKLSAHLGHSDTLARYLAELGGRSLGGSASESLTYARESLHTYQTQPEASRRCGYAALGHLLSPYESHSHTWQQLDRTLAEAQGVNLANLRQLAESLSGKRYLAVRSESVPVPSLVHWKSQHYATLLKREGDRILVRDPILGERWLTESAIKEESSGHYLVAEALSRGRTIISQAEASTLWGAGDVPGSNTGDSGTDGPAADPEKDKCDKGMCRYQVQAYSVSLNINDTPIGYAPPKGPAVWTQLSYSQRESSQPANFSWGNVGPKWTHNWGGYVQDNPGSPGNQVTRYKAGGGSVAYSGYNSATGQFAAEERDSSKLVRIVSGTQVSYERRMIDGSKEVYAFSDGAATYPRRIFLTQTIDPMGNSLTLGYDAQRRLTSITDALGQITQFAYAQPSNPLLLTDITDPFGRTSRITYTATGRLASITDMIGITSTVTYDAADRIVKLTTPYGDTTFAPGESGTWRWIQVTDAAGNTTRTDNYRGAPGIPYSEAQVPQGIGSFNAYINYRNTYFWDAETVARGLAGDYTKAHIQHWYHDRLNNSSTIGVLESKKSPLQSRIWYNYPGQGWYGANGTSEQPSHIARVLPDGSTQLTRKTYNAQGRIASEIDPVGRTREYEYDASGLDLIRVKQKTDSGYDILAEYTYNSQHLPLTYKDAAGQTSAFTYNSAGQLLSVTNPKGEVTRNEYDTRGYLIRVVNANNQTQTSYTYDAVGRKASVTDSAGRTVRYQYDNLDRLTLVTYPDGTTEVRTYDKLDLIAVKDRQGRTTSYQYDAVQRLTQQTDALGRSVSYGYDRAGRLTRLTDAKGNITNWEYDLEGREVAKVYPDGARYTIAYDSAGRIASRTDPKAQVKAYSYEKDDRLKQIAYNNAQYPTPNVSLTWNNRYPRVTQLADGLGARSYTYVPAGTPGAGNLQQENGPFAGQVNGSNDVIAWQYDPLGRVAQRSLGGVAETYGFDTLGRLTQHGNALGSFTYAYLGQTGQVSQVALAGKTLKVTYSYADNLADRALTRIQYNNGNRIDYQTVLGQILARTDSATGKQTYTYDAINRLTGVRGGCRNDDDDDEEDDDDDECDDDDEGGSVIGNLPEQYGYDAADNLTSRNGRRTNWTAQMDSANKLQNFAARIVQHDANGNVIDDGKRQYKWDAEDRLAEIRYTQAYLGVPPIDYTRFQYDGQGRRSIEQRKSLTDDSVLSEVRYRWCSDKICQQMSNQNVVLKRYFAEGELEGTTARYYGRDHLGSVVQVLNANGSKLGQAQYSAYGQTDTASGTQADSGYAGMQRHDASGLYLTWYRAYDPESGRWLSRDPIMEAGGLNVYGYVRGNPIRHKDPMGLDVYLCSQPAFGIAGNPLDHQWIKTDTKEAGMGPVNGDCGNAGNGSGDMPGDPVQVCDHSKRDKTGATCQKISGVDENKVNEQLQPGRSLGNWWPTNQCQSFAREVLNNARTSPPDPAPFDNPFLWGF